MKFLKNFLPHLAIAMAVGLVVIMILDGFNPPHEVPHQRCDAGIYCNIGDSCRHKLGNIHCGKQEEYVTGISGFSWI